MFKDVDVIYEKSLTTSNVDTVLLKLNLGSWLDLHFDPEKATIPTHVIFKRP